VEVLWKSFACAKQKNTQQPNAPTTGRQLILLNSPRENSAVLIHCPMKIKMTALCGEENLRSATKAILKHT